MLVTLGLLAFLSSIPVEASRVAQTPWTVTFTPSPDHGTIAQGIPIVTRYELVLTPLGGSALAPFDLGKPLPVGTQVAVNVQTYIAALPAGTYAGVIRTLGPGGASLSPIGPQFLVAGAGACPGGVPDVYILTQRIVPGSPGTITVEVTVTNCQGVQKILLAVF